MNALWALMDSTCWLVIALTLMRRIAAELQLSDLVFLYSPCDGVNVRKSLNSSGSGCV